MAEFVKALPADELGEGQAAVVTVNGVEVALVHTGGKFYALQNECTHAGQSIGEGDVVSEGVVECPGHAANFNVETGEPISGPAAEPLDTYEVEVVDGMVRVALE